MTEQEEFAARLKTFEWHELTEILKTCTEKEQYEKCSLIQKEIDSRVDAILK